MNLWKPDAYAKAWRFAAEAHHHEGQEFPGTELPYILHVGQVAMEVMAAIAARGGIDDPNLAVQCALLHDTVEDTAVEIPDIRKEFGPEVAAGVNALTKDQALTDKAEKMRDSLDRICDQPHAVWMVKLADRITNLQPPPSSWDQAKIMRYRDQAREIHAKLADACPVLGRRLAEKIDAYPPESIG
jgi:(p)ppGpp synthase/HD superfamily hydrolase